jgi:hypothetical protein
MKTKLLQILLVACLAFLTFAPLLHSQHTPESEQVAATRWQPNDPKPGLTG